MQSRESRKEAIRQFKELKPQAGVYAIRCISSGHVWVGPSRNLDATKNGLWFGLRTGMHREKTLQAEWDAHGEQSFAYEILGTLGDDVHHLNVVALLQEMRGAWVARLGALPLL
jgi:hypothetical protein